MIVDRDPEISTVITSFNRRELLLQGLALVEAQTVRTEVVVVDDGSTDGSIEAVAASFPKVRVIANDTGRSRGVSRQLIAGYAACRCRYIASLDEDFHLSDPQTLERLLTQFDDPRVAIVAIPFRDVLLDGDLQQAAPSDDGLWQRYTHIGNGALVDSVKYAEVGGYPDWAESYRQEEDLALRLHARGYIVRVVAPDGVAGRHLRQRKGLAPLGRYRSARNDLIFYWKYTPRRLLATYLAATALRNLRDGWAEGDVASRLRGLMAAAGHARAYRVVRAPLSLAVFRDYRDLKTQGYRPLGHLTAHKHPRHVASPAVSGGRLGQ